MISEQTLRRRAEALVLKAIVEHFVERPTHPIGDLRQFERLALGLIDVLDDATAASICAPLRAHPETPAAVYARLFEKGAASAALALEIAPDIPRASLLAAALHGPAESACAVARRADLDRELIEALIRRGEKAALRSLAANDSARFDASARRGLLQAARDDQILARILLDRADRPSEAEPLFLAATRAERSAMIIDACRRALASGTVEAPQRPDPVLVGRLERAAVLRDRDEMAAILAEALDCRKERARALVDDRLGEALALTLVSLGYTPDEATRIFLCADAAISYDVERVRALTALVASTPPRAAAQIVAAITGASRVDRDASRRARDDAPPATGWRRSASRGAAEPSRKRDLSA